MNTVRDSSVRDKTGVGRKLLQDLFYHRKLFWMLAVLILVADLWSKDAAIRLVKEHGEGKFLWVADPWFALVSETNKGGPWGIGKEHAGVLKVIRLLALGVILYILYGTPRNYRLQVLALALVMGGAAGNIWDSWTLGHVRDFLYFNLGFPPADPWPAFNLADSMICVGVFFLAVSLVLGGFLYRQEKVNAPEEKPSG